MTFEEEPLYEEEEEDFDETMVVVNEYEDLPYDEDVVVEFVETDEDEYSF